MQRSTAVKHTPFHAFHEAAGAKLIEFAASTCRSATRATSASTSCAAHARRPVRHLAHGRVLRPRPGRRGATSTSWSRTTLGLAVGQALYSPLCRPDGGIVDDLLVYRLEDEYHGGRERGQHRQGLRVACARSRRPASQLDDRSDETALLAVQGPRAAEDAARPRARCGARARLLPLPTRPHLRRRRHHRRAPATPAKTASSSTSTRACGGGVERADGGRAGRSALGARRPRRARHAAASRWSYMLYGNDIDDTTTPLEAGLGWTVKLAKRRLRRQATSLVRQKQDGLTRKLVGFELDGRRVPRHDMPIESGGQVVAASRAERTRPASSGRSGWATSRPRSRPRRHRARHRRRGGAACRRASSGCRSTAARSRRTREEAPWRYPEDVRYTQDHEWARARGRDRHRWASPRYATEQLGDIVFVELPPVGQDARGDQAVRRGRGGEDGERPLRPGGGRDRRDQHRAGREPGARQRAAVTARGWMIRVKPSQPRSAGVRSAHGERITRNSWRSSTRELRRPDLATRSSACCKRSVARVRGLCRPVPASRAPRAPARHSGPARPRSTLRRALRRVGARERCRPRGVVPRRRHVRPLRACGGERAGVAARVRRPRTRRTSLRSRRARSPRSSSSRA